MVTNTRSTATTIPFVVVVSKAGAVLLPIIIRNMLTSHQGAAKTIRQVKDPVGGPARDSTRHHPIKVLFLLAFGSLNNLQELITGYLCWVICTSAIYLLEKAGHNSIVSCVWNGEVGGDCWQKAYSTRASSLNFTIWAACILKSSQLSCVFKNKSGISINCTFLKTYIYL